MTDNVFENTLIAERFAERKFLEKKSSSDFWHKLSHMARWHMFCEKKNEIKSQTNREIERPLLYS